MLLRKRSSKADHDGAFYLPARSIRPVDIKLKAPQRAGMVYHAMGIPRRDYSGASRLVTQRVRNDRVAGFMVRGRFPVWIFLLMRLWPQIRACSNPCHLTKSFCNPERNCRTELRLGKGP